MTEIDQDGPTSERATIKFKNWAGPGICITGQKLRNDIQNFRISAAFLKGQGSEGARLAVLLDTMAGQFEKAASGQEPQAE